VNFPAALVVEVPWDFVWMLSRVSSSQFLCPQLVWNNGGWTAPFVARRHQLQRDRRPAL